MIDGKIYYKVINCLTNLNFKYNLNIFNSYKGECLFKKLDNYLINIIKNKL